MLIAALLVLALLAVEGDRFAQNARPGSGPTRIFAIDYRLTKTGGGSATAPVVDVNEPDVRVEALLDDLPERRIPPQPPAEAAFVQPTTPVSMVHRPAIIGARFPFSSSVMVWPRPAREPNPRID